MKIKDIPPIKKEIVTVFSEYKNVILKKKDISKIIYDRVPYLKDFPISIKNIIDFLVEELIIRKCVFEFPFITYTRYAIGNVS